MVDFNKLIDAYLARESYCKKIGRYYPSEIGSCLRKIWYSYKKPKPTDTELIRIFEAGNMLHTFITEVIKSEKNPEVKLLQSEMPVKFQEKDFIISGRVDNLILVEIENKKVLVEIKSCKYLPTDFKKEHAMQLQLYMHFTGIYNGILLYIQKDNLQTTCFDIIYNPEEVREILKRFHSLHLFLVNDKIPEAEAKLDPDKVWMCEKCPWKDECENDKELNKMY